jgi:CRISPR-associated protein Cas2
MGSLSGYRLMWMMVLFDLPVGTKQERKAATRFRQGLQDEGYEMSQFSVYLRFVSGKEQAAAHARRVRAMLPSTGKVHVLFFTDKQYENILRFDGRRRAGPLKNPEQYVLF